MTTKTFVRKDSLLVWKQYLQRDFICENSRSRESFILQYPCMINQDKNNIINYRVLQQEPIQGS